MLKLATSRSLLARLLLALLILATCASPVFAATGDLDPSFHTVGFTTTNLITKDEALAVAIQGDGKIVAAGYSTGIGTAKDFSLVRYLPNGALDIDFGIGGKTITQAVPGNLNDIIHAIALDSQGNILVVGEADIAGGKSDFVVARYLSATGFLDPTFGSGGIVLTSLSAKNDVASAIAIQPNGKILVGGTSDDNFALARYDTNGVLDPAFNGVGFVVTDFGKTDVASALALQPDGKIVLGGSSDAGASGDDFALARYTDLGALDPTFNATGKVVTNFLLHSNEGINALALQLDGKIVAAGRTNSNGGDFALARYRTTGLLDATFGAGAGFQATTLGAGTDEAFALAVVHPGEDILVAGTSNQGGASLNDFALVRLKNDGSFDPGFGSGGVVSTNFAANQNDFGFAMALQADHNIVVAGSSDPGGELDFAVARYLSPNQLPVLAEFPAAGFEDAPLAFSAADFTSHYSDADNDPLVKVKLTSLPAHGVLKLNGSAVALSQEIPAASLGGLSFQPDANWNGATSFSWNAFDGIAYAAQDAALNLSLQAVNDAPSFSKGSDLRLDPTTTAQTFSAWATGISAGPADEAGQALTFHVTSDTPALFAQQPAIDASGQLTFTPAAGQFGTATVSVTLQDDGGTANGGIDAGPLQTFKIVLDPHHVYLPSILR